MALWGKNGAAEKRPADHSLSILGEGAQMQGTLQVPGNLRIEGAFQGQLTVGHRLVIAESAQVKGVLQAQELLIAGTFEGEIRDCEHVEITGTARVRGTIRSQKLEVQKGAILHLTCQIGELGHPPPAGTPNGLPPQAEASTKSPAPSAPVPKHKHK
jgi:cytoskeletal protein CcmA (bactofilin family)